jgi:hypothetical protein
MLLHERSGPLQSHEPLELERSPLLAKEESSGEKWPTEFRLRLTRNRKGSLTCRKSATQDPRLYIPSEGRHAEDFYTRKNQTTLAGFEPTNSGTRGQRANH